MVDTLKTAVVVVLLLAVLYGVYVVLNKPEQYPQELAWETDAADPALQIELGIPEPAPEASNSAPPQTSFPVVAWDTTSTASNQSTNDSPTLSQNELAPPDLSSVSEPTTQPSLPIPELATSTIDSPTTSVAPPDLIGGAGAAPSTTEQVAATEASSKSDNMMDAPADTAASGVSNALRDGTSASTSAAMSNDFYGASNRYSGVDNSAAQDTAEVAPSAPSIPPATSTQANVNDISESSPVATSGSSFQAAYQSAQMKIQAEAWFDALVKLSAHYNDASLTATEYNQLIDLLDPLAGKVIYSNEHLIEPAYKPQAGDTIENIAARYQVPWQLLANINGIENPNTLLAGRELKVVRGPFRAEISLSKNELTLFADKLYAGRFKITTGNDPAPLPGQYQVNDKQPGRTYYVAGSGQTIPIDDPSNPYGRVWIDLGSNLSIHGSSPNGVAPGQGCIALTARDANDVFGILSQGSSVVIVR